MDAETLQKQVSKIVQSKPSSLTFDSHVGRSKEVFLSSPKRKGCHWTMTYLDLVSNSWFYCNTLGWNPPFNLKKEINRVLDAIDNIYCLPKKPYKKFFICHTPSSIYIHHHNCSSKCFKNFPFQTCGNVCGAIIAILAVVAQKVPNVWQKVILSPTGNLPSGLKWLLEPTTYSDYLRELIISWLVKGEIDVAFIENCLKDEVVQKIQDLVSATRPCESEFVEKSMQSVAHPHPPVLKVLHDAQHSVARLPVSEIENALAPVVDPPAFNVLEDTQHSLARPPPFEMDEAQPSVVLPSILEVLGDTQNSAARLPSGEIDETPYTVVDPSVPVDVGKTQQSETIPPEIQEDQQLKDKVIKSENRETCKFTVGERFASLIELDEPIERYECHFFCQLWKRDARTLDAARKRVPKRVENANQSLKYYSLKLSCKFGGKASKPREKIIRPSS
jgi:hypothetical protein